MAKDKANGDGTSAEIQLVLNGKGGSERSLHPLVSAKSLRCIDAVLTANGSLIHPSNEPNSISGKYGGGPPLARGTEQRLRRLYPLEWVTSVHEVLSVGARERPIVSVLLGEHTTFERHYRVNDLARLWGLGRETVRKLVKDDPGVIKIRMGRKKAHTVYSVPESAAQRIHTRLLNVA
jgi:hypothetical protein